MERSTDKGFWGCTGLVLAALIAGIFLLISTDKIVIPPIIIPTSVPPTPIGIASASINSVTVDYNAEESSEPGLRIDINFTIEHRKDIECEIAAYFFYADGSYLLDNNKLYKATDGQVAVSRRFTPPYEGSTYKGFSLFMPLKELDLSPGNYILKFHVSIYDLINDATVTQSENFSFSYDKP